MNKSYKVVYSEARGKYVAVSELTQSSAGRGRSMRFVSVSTLVAAIGAALLAGTVPAFAVTHTGTVDPVTGQVTIDLGNGDTIVIPGVGYFSINTSDNRRDDLTTSAQARGAHTLAIGEQARAQGPNSVALGYKAVSGNYSVTIGNEATHEGGGNYAVSIGTSVSSGNNSIAIGHSGHAGKNSAAIGWRAYASESSVAMGDDSTAHIGATALGSRTHATGDRSIAVGMVTWASSVDSAAVGTYAWAKAENAIALGSYSVADEADTVSVGRVAGIDSGRYMDKPEARKRRIVNVAEGTAASNAATVSQTATVESADPASSFLTVDGTDTNDNGSKKYKLSLTVSDDVNGETEGLVTNKTVKAALASLSTGVASNYALIDASNLTEHEADWASALGTGVIRPAAGTTQSRALLVTGAAVYDEVKLSRDGDYAKIAQTTGDNLLALDDKLQEVVGTISRYNANLEEVKNDLQGQIITVSGAAQTAQNTANAAKDAAEAAQGTADTAVADAAKAMTEAKKHTTVTSDGTIKVEKGVSAETGGAEYKLSIAEDADFTAKQTTWKSEDGKVSTANSSGFFSGGTSAADSDAYVSDGVVSAGKSEATKITLDGNTGKASFGNTVTIDGATGRISGLTAGEVSENSTDAVTGAQLYEVQQGVARNAEGLESLGRAVNKVDRKIDRTGALAAALAGLHPQDYDEDHPVSGAVGIGHYKGKQALAVGMFVRPVENFMVSLGASGSADDYMLNAGASFRFGGPTLKKSPQQMAARLSDQEVTIRDLSAQNLAQKTRLESQDEKLLKQASEIKDQKAEISAQKARLESQDAKLERQASEIEELKALMAKIQAKLGK